MTTYGLINSCDNSKVPLHSINVTASIQGFIANIETELLYQNFSDDPIEACFVFPIDDSCAVYKFNAVVDDRVIVGECQGKQQARETYEDAMAAGETAFLMEEDDSSGDVFECKVGNLPPKSAAKVQFAFVRPCKVEDSSSSGVTSFVYPCVLGPRYSVTTAPNQASTSDTQQSNVSTTKSSKKKNKKEATYTSVEDIPYTFTAVVTYYCTGSNKVTLMSANSPGNYRCEKINNSSSKLIIDSFELDKDLEVEIHCTEPNRPMMYVEKGDKSKDGLLKEDMVMLQFHPNITELVKQSSKKGEYIFVIDRSGSMGGDRISQAKKALLECLQLLPDDCYFNIVSFGSTHSHLFNSALTGSSKKNSKANMDRAVALVKSMDADMGGTEMVTPFEWILRHASIPQYPKQIILLTDGAIWGGYEEKFFNMIKTNRDQCRVFTFGIGFGASTHLIRGLARAGNGKCDFIKEDMHKMKKQVAHLLHCAMSPAVTDVQVKVTTPKSVSHLFIPTELPPIFLGENFVTYLCLTGDIPVSGRSTLKCELSGQSGSDKLQHKLQVDLAGLDNETIEGEDLPIHRLAGKAQIKQLQDDEEYDGANKDKIVLVSTAVNIMSRYTSFVGVDKGRTQKVKGKAIRVDIPIAKLTEASQRAKRMKQPAAAAAAPPVRQYGGAGPDAPQIEKYIGGKVPDIPGIEFHGMKSKNTKASQVSEVKTTQMDTMERQATCKDQTEGQGQMRTGNSRKRKQKAGSRKLSVKKSRRVTRVCEALFALWRDGFYYYATFVKTSHSYIKDRVNKEMRFKDGALKMVSIHDVLQARVLSPGDIISVHSCKNTYHWAMVLEYTAKSDEFLVALGSGAIVKYDVTNIVIPSKTAQKMKDRSEFDATPKRLVMFTGSDGLTRELTTSDLAELNSKGWINEAIVSFWLSKVLPSVSSKELLERSFVFSPRFFFTLTDSLQMSEEFLELPDELQPVIVERPWRNYILRSDKWRGSQLQAALDLLNGVDITEKDMLIIPMYEDYHWYVITVEVNQDPLEKTAYRASFSTMDSYYKCRRDYEVGVIKKFLVECFGEKGKVLRFEDGVYQFHVPIQGNDWDCGLCALQCIHHTYQENLQPKPHLWWFYQQDLIETRQHIAKAILDNWHED